MSSVQYNDNSCVLSADKVSCDAMSTLAKDEYFKNKIYEQYLLQDPSCFRYQSLANREEEHQLQKNGGISRNLCFEKTPQFQQGPWEEVYKPSVELPTFYEKWTRAKNNTVTCQKSNFECPSIPIKSTDTSSGPEGFSFR